MSQQKQGMGMKTLCTNYFMLRLTLLIAPIGVVDRANAACAPASPVNNVTVTCTGATANQNGSDGCGTNTDTGNTYNISLRRRGHGNKRRPDLQYLGNGQ